MSEQGRDLVYQSGQWQVHLGRRELLAGDVAVPLGARAFEIVAVLVQSANDLVTKNDLMDRIWPGATVEENTLQVHISAIRKAFGQDRHMLRTLSGRGYRLLGNWTPRQQTSAATAPIVSSQMHEAGPPRTDNFPQIAERLIGRATAAQHVRDLASAYRVVTLAGTGGIGKTSLALEAARGLLADFEGGGWLVELASLSNPDLVPSTVASALDLKLSGEILAESVARAVGARHLLLVLDNCEHVIDAAANLVESFLSLCPRTTILATSREVLRVNGEHVYRVLPLEVPAVDEKRPDDVLGCSAVELFITRAKALDSDFVVQTEALPAIGAICRHLDGIPLAIEFAAARAAMLGVRQVTDDLQDRLALLTRGRRTALPRHQTLRAVLDWSHELLTEAERLLLCRLAIFPAGFTLDAVIAVMDDSGLEVAAMMDGIANLVSKSLVMSDRSENGSRWYLLETTRAYALEKLRDSGEARQTARRQVEFCLEFFVLFGTEGRLQAALDELDRYRVEVDNLRAALNWAFSSDGDVALGVALAATVADFWAAASLVPEACEWAGTALAQIGTAAGTRREMVLQCSFGITRLLTKGMSDDARAALMRARTLAREFSDLDYQQRTTHSLWLFSMRASAIDDAIIALREFEQTAGLHDPLSRVVVDCLLGVTLIYRPAHVEAIERVQRALAQYPSESRRRDMIRFAGGMPPTAAAHISVSLLSRGLVDTASRTAANAIEEARGGHNPVVLCVALAWASGYIFLSLGELAVSERYDNELIAAAAGHALRGYHAVGLCVRGSLAVKRGELNAGASLIGRGLAEMREVRYRQFYPFFLVELAGAMGALGRIDDGLAEIDAALRFAAETGYQWFVPETLRVKGQLFALRDPNDVAVEDCFIRGLDVAREQDALFWELRLALSLARLRATQNRHGAARQVLAPVYDRFTEGFAAADMKAARTLLDGLGT